MWSVVVCSMRSMSNARCCVKQIDSNLEKWNLKEEQVVNELAPECHESLQKSMAVNINDCNHPGVLGVEAIPYSE